jgi:hypothetical protein
MQSKRIHNTKMNFRTRKMLRDSLNSSVIGDHQANQYYSKPLSNYKSRRLPSLHSKASRPRTKQPQKNSQIQKNMMKYEEIKRIHEEFRLERHEVYTLMSEFNSMLYLQENDSDDSDGEIKEKKAPKPSFDIFGEGKGN